MQALSGGIAKTRSILRRKDAAAFCTKHQVSRPAVFGSYLRGDLSPDSDIDLLVEFRPGAAVGFLDVATMELEPAQLMGRKVDLRTAAELSPLFRNQVLAGAETLYVHR